MTKSPHQLTKNVKLLQKVALVLNNKILVLKRADDSYSRPNYWDLPGGNVEWPVSLKQDMLNLHQDDVVREVLEETGIKVEKIEFDTIENLVLFRTFFEVDKDVFSVIVGWKVKINTEEKLVVELSNEHQAYAWVSQDEIKNYDFGGERGEFIVQIIKSSF